MRRELILGLDHLVVLVANIDAATITFGTLSGRMPVWRASRDGAATCLFNIDNVVIELMAADGDGPSADRIRAAVGASGEGLASICFRTDDIDRLHRRLGRVRLDPEPVTDGSSVDLASGSTRSWRRTRAATACTYGVRHFFLQPDTELPVSRVAGDAEASGFIGLDHLVIETPNAERAAALYGARLGLDMALDRLHGERGQLMFFRCGDVIVEVVRTGSGPRDTSNDSLFGLTWRVANADAAHARLSAAGVNVSEVRAGLKPGSRVLTVRDHTLGIRTLLIEHGERIPA